MGDEDRPHDPVGLEHHIRCVGHEPPGVALQEPRNVAAPFLLRADVHPVLLFQVPLVGGLEERR
jgi:hypothetical protein